jgi:ATP-dependent DNA helicase RecQ
LQIADAQIKLESPNALKPYFDYFEEKKIMEKSDWH